jgi:MbtH protein
VEPDEEEAAVYDVVVNIEEQYSIWRVGKKLPEGWRRAAFSGSKDDCLAWIEREWTDMRPLSLRQFMDRQRDSDDEQPVG